MLEIVIPARDSIELWDELNQEFINLPSIKEQKLQLEHSLISLSKWESKWNKPFLPINGKKDEKTNEELLDYIKYMTITKNVDPNTYQYLTEKNVLDIEEYIKAPMTATTFSTKNGGEKNNEIVTSEIIYYWMIALNIPFECQRWHLNRLLTLIRVCSIKNEPPKKRSSREIMNRNAAINAARKKKYNTKG